MLCHHASHNGRRWRVGTPNPWQWFLPLPSYPWCDKLKTSLIKTLGDVFDLLGPNHVYHALELSQLALTSCATGCIKSTPTFRPTNDSMDWKALFHRHRFTHTEVSCTRSHHPAVVKIKKTPGLQPIQDWKSAIYRSYSHWNLHLLRGFWDCDPKIIVKTQVPAISVTVTKVHNTFLRQTAATFKGEGGIPTFARWEMRSLLHFARLFYN